MRTNRLGTALVAILVVLAGCSGGVPGSTNSPDGANVGPSTSNPEDGTVNFYVSDEENAIDDFEHLNVTITEVGFQRAGDGDEDDGQDSDGTGNETDASEDSSEEAGGESGGWVEHDVDNRSVDLTELKGENATHLAEFDVPDGEYTKVFAHVGEVDATLANGERTNVKLPSGKLQLNKPFTVGTNASVDFVFDISVHEAGKSGKYVLKPVIGESGTDVPIERIDDERAADEGDDLRATFPNDVAPGENATIEVTRNGSTVENATVSVDDEVVGTTDGDGRLVLQVPTATEEFEVSVTDGEDEAELEAEFESGDDGDEDDRADESEDGQRALGVEFVGQVEPGEMVTIKADRDGAPLANATVLLDDETIGTTDQNGRLDFETPEEEFEITVEHGDDEAEIEAEFETAKGNGKD